MTFNIDIRYSDIIANVKSRVVGEFTRQIQSNMKRISWLTWIRKAVKKLLSNPVYEVHSGLKILHSSIVSQTGRSDGTQSQDSDEGSQLGGSHGGPQEEPQEEEGLGQGGAAGGSQWGGEGGPQEGATGRENLKLGLVSLSRAAQPGGSQISIMGATPVP